jgi:hypothetical protein
MKKTLLAGAAALSVLSASAAHARSVSITCEGKIGWHPLSAYTAVSKGGLENECVFVTRSNIGRKILKVCPKGSQCSIEADVDNTSLDREIYRIISINRIDTSYAPCEHDLHKDCSYVEEPPEINSPGTDEIREDWCRRNNSNGTAESCKGLKDTKPWPKWLLK